MFSSFCFFQIFYNGHGKFYFKKIHKYGTCRNLADAWFKGSCKRVMLVMVSVTALQRPLLLLGSPCLAAQTAYLVHRDKLLPYPQPLTEKKNTSCRNYPLHSYSGGGSYLHPTLQR